MNKIFDQDTLAMLYDELGMDFDYGIYEGKSDREIYNMLPDSIKALLSDFGLNASWMHDGM